MKNIQHQLIVFFFALLTIPLPGFSQDALANELWYEVYKIYPPLSITKEKLGEAQTLIDLNENYKASWVRDYISVEVSAICKGKIRKAMGKNDNLSPEQKNLMNQADVGTAITVKVRYIPENTLKHNPPKEMDFTFVLDPESDAKYPGGHQQLKQYFKQQAINKIPEGRFKGYDWTAIKFTIDKEGKIINTHPFEASKDDKINALLSEAIRNMPCWQPAEYANGLKVKQEYVLAVGNPENCMMNLLNIRQD